MSDWPDPKDVASAARKLGRAGEGSEIDHEAVWRAAREWSTKVRLSPEYEAFIRIVLDLRPDEPIDLTRPPW